MKNISIKAFINSIFLVVFMALSLSFWLFWELDKTRFALEENAKYDLLAQSFLSHLEQSPTKDQILTHASSLLLSPVQEHTQKIRILQEAQEAYTYEQKDSRIRAFIYEGKRYLYLQQYGYNLMFAYEGTPNYLSKIIILIYLLFLVILASIYFAFRKKLRPLQNLQKKMDAFSKGNMSVHLEHEGDDEIGKIAQTFNHAVEHINHLISSKNLFMRNMMHELKTPITKGMIVTQMLPQVSEKEYLQNAFSRMNEIISDLANIEKISSGFLDLKKEKIPLAQVLDKTKQLLLSHDKRVTYPSDALELYIDANLFALALKNLIDNAQKFSTEKIYILADANSIEIASQGEKLPFPLAYYTEPFSQGEKRDLGYGLGLYIVKIILDAHHFTLEYRYENQQNKFIVVF